MAILAYGYPYYKGSAIFSLVFLSTTSEKSFIPYKASAAVQTFKVCPLRPRVLSSWGITLLQKLRAANESYKLETALSSSVQYFVPLKLLRWRWIVIQSWYNR